VGRGRIKINNNIYTLINYSPSPLSPRERVGVRVTLFPSVLSGRIVHLIFHFGREHFQKS
jgi:hypothetical protein